MTGEGMSEPFNEYDFYKAQYDQMERNTNASIVRRHLPAIANYILTLIQEYDPDEEGKRTFDDALRLAHKAINEYDPHTNGTLLNRPKKEAA